MIKPLRSEVKPLCWAEPSSFPSIEAYQLHVVEYYAEVNEDIAHLRPAIQVLKNQTHYRSDLIKACERVVRDYFNALPEGQRKKSHSGLGFVSG
jgi:hypothetical protein